MSKAAVASGGGFQVAKHHGSRTKHVSLLDRGGVKSSDELEVKRKCLYVILKSLHSFPA